MVRRYQSYPSVMRTNSNTANNREIMRKSTGGFFSKLTSNAQKTNRKSAGRPDLSDKLSLEKVLGLTTTNRNGLACNPITGVVAYPAGCVIVLYDPKTNGQSHIFNPDRKTITCVNFSCDGKYLASGESGQQPLVRVWELNETLTQVAELKGHKTGIASVEFSPNQKLLVSIGDQHDMLVNVWNWKLCQTVACNKSGCRVRALSFCEDGSYLVTVGNRHVKFWYLDSESSSVKANTPTIPINGRSGILGDQKNNVFTDVMCGRGICSKYTYCVTKSGLLCLFNEKRIMEKWVELEAGSTNCLVVTEKYIFCGCSNGLIRVFETLTLKFIASLPRPHPLGVNVSEAILPSDLPIPAQNQTCPDLVALCLDEERCKLTSVYNDHSIYIWDVHDVKKVGKVASFLYHSACIWGVEMYPYFEDCMQSCLPNHSFLTCSADDTVRIWNLDKGSLFSKNYPRNQYSKELLKTIYIDAALANLQDTSMVPSSKESDVRNGIRCMQISPNGQVIATGDRTGNLRIYEMQFFEELYRIEAHESEILCVEFSSPASGFNLLASSSRDRLIHIFDAAKSYELLQTIDDHSSSITAVRFNYDVETLQLLSCGADKVVMFHSAQVNEYGQINFIRNTIVPGKATLYDMGVEPTRKYVATVGQDRHLRIYDIQGAKQLHCYKGSLSEEGNLIKFQFDGGGVYAAISCSDKTIGIYDFASGECQATVYGHSELVTGLKFTPDGKNLISVSGDGCIFVWGLPFDFCENIRARMLDLNLQLPPDQNVPSNSMDSETRRQTYTLQPEEQFNSSEKWLAENGNATPRSSLPGYRFSVGQLPVWAQKQMRPGNTGGPAKGSSQPLGRWGERTEGLTTVPEILTTARLYSEDSVLSSNGSEKSDQCVVDMAMEEAWESQVIYPRDDSQVNECNRSFQVTQSSHKDDFNDSLDQDEIEEHMVTNGEYSNEEDSEPVSDCLSGSPDVSDQESDSADRNSPLMEHFERLGTPTGMSVIYNNSSMENESPHVVKLSRSMSISAKFLSKSQTRPSRKVSTGSLSQSPDEQKRKMDNLKEKFKLNARPKNPNKKGMPRQNSISNLSTDDQARSGQLKKNKLVSRSCQNLSSFNSPHDFERTSIKSTSSNSSISNISGFEHRNSSTPIYPKHGKPDDNKGRRRSEINSWGPEQGMRIKRSDSTNSSEQFPVKTTNKKISPQIGRRRSVETCAAKSAPSGTSGVVMRKPRNKTARPRSMLVESNTKKDYGKQLKNVYHSDDENDNLFSKMKQAFKQKRSPDQSDKLKHSPDFYSLDQSPSHVYKKTPLHTSTQNKPPLHSYNSSSKKSPPDIRTQNNKQSPSQRHSLNNESSPLRRSLSNESPPQIRMQIQQPRDSAREIDISAIEDVDMNSFIADQQTDRILRVVNEIDSVIHTQNLLNNSTNHMQTHKNKLDDSIVMNMMQESSYLNCGQQILSRTPPERDVPRKSSLESSFVAAGVVEEIDMELPSPVNGVCIREDTNNTDHEAVNGMEESSPEMEGLWNEAHGILNNLVNSYNETAEFQNRVLDQPESDVQRQLLSLISRTYHSIENSINEQRKMLDRNIEMNSEARSVMESDRFKELAKVINPVNKPNDDGNMIDMISVLDKYSSLLLDVVASKKNRETLIE